MTDILHRTLAGRYRVDEFIGKGGTAEMYRVWDTRRSATLAMKLLLADLALDRAFLRRFRREAQTLERLQHPNIVRYYGLEQDGELTFILMDYIQGGSLKQLIFHADGPMPFDRVLDITRQLCQALQYAHHEGFVHADVKPANVLIDQAGRPMLSDFGISRMTETATSTMVGAGTPAYMSPEQARGQNPTPLSDLYSLGIVLFEMLTGERPFDGQNARTGGTMSEKIRWEQLNLPCPSARHLNPAISPELDAVVRTCLEKDPALRYPDAIALLNALSRAVNAPAPGAAGTAVEDATLPGTMPPGVEAPSPVPVVPRKLSRGTKGLLFSGAVVVLAVAAGLAFSLGRGGSPSATVPIDIPATVSAKLRPAMTPTQAPLATPTPMPPITAPTLGIGSTLVSTADHMTDMYVPAGTFTMGGDNPCAFRNITENDCFVSRMGNYPIMLNSQPHDVYLDAYWIDQTEVTNAMYALCVAAGACAPPRYSKSATRTSYYGNSEYGNYPVVYVSWDDANSYCSWAHRRLPTEAEWAKAARGTDDRAYPWGNTPPDSTLANFGNQVNDTTAVDAYPRGSSPYQALGMAGNVWEWVSDWYDASEWQRVLDGSRSAAYGASTTQPAPLRNPAGPKTGNSRVIRGGSWLDSAAFLPFNLLTNDTGYNYLSCRDPNNPACHPKYKAIPWDGQATIQTGFRYWSAPASELNFLGFRCAQNGTP